MEHQTFNVLFLCTGNSARSIMGEALLNSQAQGRFRAFSAGSAPAGEVHPFVLELLERHRLVTAGLRSKSWNEFAQPDAPHMDFVITVCDRAKAEVCPIWPGQPMSAHWGVEDPTQAEGPEDRRRKAFSDALMLLSRRIAIFANLPLDKLNKLALQRELDRIGRET
ncbi:arsenate reductase ArsC [Ramlibacter rhizophilus]|uniref:Arsenate reductase ArsC n=1 Tax=Ramlibacter rhizophilus TaxID=1781167 RepID=A0A4Z0BRR1_9BURK|nr:arsenate reductase ArsC [Ramlibacter rhizophilus]TFZ01090.1 arsenate reductase ArsC [Ramlibacter rhizophilus]